MQMTTPVTLVQACLTTLSRHEEETGIAAAAIGLMYGVDPASPWVVVYPIPLEDLRAAVEYGADLRTALNPAEHREELELPVDIDDGDLPSGDELASLVSETVQLLRQKLPDKLVYMTDPEHTVLIASVQEQALPARLSFLPGPT